MQALQIEDIRSFMSSLLTGSAFHHFETVEATLTTFVTFHVDGVCQHSYFDSEPASDEQEAENRETPSRYITWQILQPHMYELIRGKKPPLSFHLVLRLSDANTAKVLESSHLSFNVQDIAGLYINIHFEKGHATIISGSSLNVFTVDKSLEHTWEELVQKLLRREKIAFTVL